MQKTLYFKKTIKAGDGVAVHDKHYFIKVEMELKEDDSFSCFSCCGTIYLNGVTVCAGQCLDEIREIIPSSKIFSRIYRLWRLYHLNDMHAGTQKQEKALRDAGLLAFADEYEKCCDYLRSINLYDDHGHKFGTAWLKHEIPERDLTKIKTLMK